MSASKKLMMIVEFDEDDIGNVLAERTAEDVVSIGDAFGVVKVLEAKWVEDE